MSFADMFKTTVIKTTINGKEVTDEQQKAFDKVWESFDKTMESFDSTMKTFDEAVSNVTSVQEDEVELYGATKAEVLSKTEKYSTVGFKLIDLVNNISGKEDYWVARMKKGK